MLVDLNAFVQQRNDLGNLLSFYEQQHVFEGGPVDGLLPGAEGVRGLGDRGTGQLAGGGAGALRAGHPGDPATGFTARLADPIPRRLRVRDPDHPAALPTQRHPGRDGEREDLNARLNNSLATRSASLLNPSVIHK